VNDVCWGEQLAFSASDDKKIRVWNIELKQCKAILNGH